MVQRNTLELLFPAGNYSYQLTRDAFKRFYDEGCVVYITGPGHWENDHYGMRGEDVMFEARYSLGTALFACFTQEAYERTIALCRRFCVEQGEDVTDPTRFCEDDKNRPNDPCVYFGDL